MTYRGKLSPKYAAMAPLGLRYQQHLYKLTGNLSIIKTANAKVKLHRRSEQARQH